MNPVDLRDPPPASPANEEQDPEEKEDEKPNNLILMGGAADVDQEGNCHLAPWFLNSEFSDVTLFVGKAKPNEDPVPVTTFPMPDSITYCSIPAHRICLSRISPYFKVCLTSKFEEAKEKKIHLPEDPHIFLILLKALYTNKVVLRDDSRETGADVVAVLQIADRYQCESVVEVVKQHIMEQVTHLKGATQIGSGLMRPPMNPNFQTLLDRALCTIIKDFKDFITTLRSLDCSEQLLLRVLQRFHTHPYNLPLDGAPPAEIHGPSHKPYGSEVSAIQLFSGIVEWADALLLKRHKRLLSAVKPDSGKIELDSPDPFPATTALALDAAPSPPGLLASSAGSPPQPLSNKTSGTKGRHLNSPPTKMSRLEERRQLLTPMLAFVQFNQMSPLQLINHVKPADLIPEEQLFRLLCEATVAESEIVRVIEFIGTDGGKQPFQNPHPLEVNVTASSTNDEPTSGVIGLEPANFWTDHDTDEENEVDPFVEVDFNSRRIIPRAYQFSVLAPCVPMRNWNLEGWCEQTTSWDILKEHRNDLSFPDYEDSSFTSKWELPWTEKSYRRVRVRCTAANFDDFKDVVLCCLEFYAKIV